jgi:hypothetical protein
LHTIFTLAFDGKWRLVVRDSKRSDLAAQITAGIENDYDYITVSGK